MEATDLTQWARDRLDQDYIVAVGGEIRSVLLKRVGSVEVSFTPGDMTVYGLVFTRLDDQVVRIGRNHAHVGVGARPERQYVANDGWVQVALVNWERVHVFQLLAPEGCFVHPASVREHLCDNDASSIALAELLNRIGLTEW